MRKKESHRKIAIRTIQGAKIPETTAERDRNQVVKGENVECEFHAKPAEGVSPDLCARIYFATGTEAPFVKVGYIGRHTV